MIKVSVVVPNWNGVDSLGACLDSLTSQTQKCQIVVVENGSTDGSRKLLAEKYPGVTALLQDKNLGFAGGVNVGIRHALASDTKYVALFNNDAIADKAWLASLVEHLEEHPTVGIATSKLLNFSGAELDSTGEGYSVWGLPYPRGRGETDLDKYDHQTEVFGASGGASLYRTELFKDIGLFDESFFAYYEDVDISFRAQLAGWKVEYVPTAVAYHQIGSTSSKLKGFTTYQTLKNLPMLLVKNVPRKYLWRILWRYMFVENLFVGRAILRGHFWASTKGKAMGNYRALTSLGKRRVIQRSKTVSDEYIWGMMVHDLPPNAQALRKLRALWWKLINKKVVD